uniref:Uncharacterized protein n=1 Tax=Aegilops tauschii TaxID=37682 RepID=M8BVE5_AEGTA
MASTCALLQVDCWSSMRRVGLLQQHLRYSLDELQVGQAVDEDSTTTTEGYKQQCNESRNLHLNTALFSEIRIFMAIIMVQNSI